MAKPIKNVRPNTRLDETDFIQPEIVQRYIDKFNKANKNDWALYSKEAMLWFSDRIRKDTRIDRKKLLTAHEYTRRKGTEGKSLIGRLFFFQYEAVMPGDKESGLYDKFPLIFIFNYGKNQEGDNLVWGINFHYLTPRERLLMFTALLKIKTTQTYTEKTKLRLSWNLIKSVSANVNLALRAVHAYRIDRFQSKMIEIAPQSWEMVIPMRTEMFMKPRSEEVVLQSRARKHIRKQASKKR